MANGTAGRKVNPRTVRIQNAVLSEGVKLLVNEGREGVTALRISEEAGVARSTIYRHWPDQQSLLLAVVDWIVTPQTTTLVTDNLESDLTEALVALTDRLLRRPFRIVFSTLLDAANSDPSFLDSQRRFVNGVLQRLRDILAAGVERGELPDSLDLDTASAKLAGPIFMQHVMLNASVDDELLSKAAKDFLCSHARGHV